MWIGLACGNSINKHLLWKKLKRKTFFKTIIVFLILSLHAPAKQIQQNLTDFYMVSFINYAFDLQNQNSHLSIQTPLHYSNLLLELQIFMCLLLQVSSRNLPTSTNVPFS